MLKDHQVMRLNTVDGGIVEAEVNYSNNPKVESCGIVRFSYNGVEFDISKDVLMSLMLAIGTPTENEKLLPMKLKNIKKIERLLTFEWQASRDYQKGEKITVRAPWIDEVPTEQEVLAGNVSGRKKKMFDIVHKNIFSLGK